MSLNACLTLKIDPSGPNDNSANSFCRLCPWIPFRRSNSVFNFIKYLKLVNGPLEIMFEVLTPVGKVFITSTSISNQVAAGINANGNIIWRAVNRLGSNHSAAITEPAPLLKLYDCYAPIETHCHYCGREQCSDAHEEMKIYEIWNRKEAWMCAGQNFFISKPHRSKKPGERKTYVLVFYLWTSNEPSRGFIVYNNDKKQFGFFFGLSSLVTDTFCWKKEPQVMSLFSHSMKGLLFIDHKELLRIPKWLPMHEGSGKLHTDFYPFLQMVTLYISCGLLGEI